MNVYLDGDVLYIEHEGVAPLDVLQRGAGEVAVVFTLPTDAVELHTADGAVSEVLGRVRHALSSVKMSAKARDEVERALDDLEPDDES